MILKYKFICCLLLSFITLGLNAQLFTQILSGDIATSNKSSGGCSWGDYNNDGYPDLFISNTNTDNQLFKNNGDGTFEEITTGDIVNDSGISNTAVWGDYNNDGNLDIFVSNNPSAASPPQVNFLYKNDGAPDYTFTKVFIPATQTDANYTWSSSWVDFDNDGDLDLHMPDNKHLRTDFFYENNGDDNFTSITPSFVTPNVESTGVVSWIDYDHDGDQDLFMIKSGRTHPDNGEDNRIYHNLLSETGNLEFQRVHTADLVNHFDLDFQASWGDYDNDGDMDVYLGNFDDHNYLYRNEGDSLFTQISTGPAVTNITFTLGSTFGDFDNDGDLDLYVLNTNGQASRYYQNDGAGNFTIQNSATIGSAVTNFSAAQGSASADYDNDGDLDLFVANSFNNSNARNYLYQNSGNANNHIQIKCEGTISNAAAIGAKVWVKATINGNPIWQLRHITGSPTGNRAQSDLRVHFGLGDASTVDSLIIEWPLGLKETYTNISSNQILTYIEGQVTTNAQELEETKFNFQAYPNPTIDETNISFHIEEKVKSLALRVVDTYQREVIELFHGEPLIGKNEFKFTTSKLPIGVYYIILETNNTHLSKPLLVIKK